MSSSLLLTCSPTVPRKPWQGASHFGANALSVLPQPGVPGPPQGSTPSHPAFVPAALPHTLHHLPPEGLQRQAERRRRGPGADWKTDWMDGRKEEGS